MQKTPFRVRAWAQGGFLALIATFALTALLPATAAAERPEPLIQFPADGELGSAAGQIGAGVLSMAASPVSGDVYVVDDGNARVDEFTAWGEFVRAFGWNVNASAPEEKLQVCTTATGCKQGSEGTGDGQFGQFQRGGIAIDPSGNVYVGDLENHRVQKFSASGEFLLAFGSTGTGDGQFSTFQNGNFIALSPDGESVYVGDRERIQVFGDDGSFKEQFTFKALHEEDAAFPEVAVVNSLAVDPGTGDLYVGVAEFFGPGLRNVKYVFRLDSDTGKVLSSLTAPVLTQPTALATDSDGNLYVIGDLGRHIVKFDAMGNQLIPSQEEEEERKKVEGEGKVYTLFGRPSDGTSLSGLTTNGACESESDDYYVAHTNFALKLSYVEAYGPPPQNATKCPPPPPATPEIDAQYATSVGTDSAVLKAEINPHYALDATYYVQYGSGKCSEGGCTSEKPLPPGAGLTTEVFDAPVKTTGVALLDLEPATTYHYRFVVQSSGGGPVRGVGGEVGVDGAEGTFTTVSLPSAPFTDCPNQVFRTGSSAFLPDCRAYELVSPPDRSPAGDIVAIGHFLNGASAELDQSAADGEKLAYTSEYAFADAIAGPPNSEYIASRVAGKGWSTHGISPPRGPIFTTLSGNLKLDVEEKAFTEDLCSSWLMHVTSTLLSDDAVPGFTNFYQRDNCGSGADSYDSISPAEAPIAGPHTYIELQGFSSDGSQSVIVADAALTADAPSTKDYKLYWTSEGVLRFICTLPNGTPYVGGCAAGTGRNGALFPTGRTSSVSHAVSEDVSRVYWSASAGGDGEGVLYLRENTGEEQSAMAAGKCSEEEKACSYSVSAPGVSSRFWTAAADGSKALYTERVGPADFGNLREYDAETRKSKLIVSEALGVAGGSDDLSRFYFGSKKRIGGEGVAGEPNLYLSDEGAISLVATLAELDLLNPYYLALGPLDMEPIAHGARTSADGRHLLFASVASLTGYDNHDAAGGHPDAEVYLYDAGSAGPVCVSCNPSGERPGGRTFSDGIGVGAHAAALIPAGNTQLHTPRALSEDGDSVFFESFEGLVARDTNGKADVYEWSRAGDAAVCEALGAELHVEASGGCLSLISSGQGSADSQFVDASVDGEDVFIRTASSLVAQDHGLIDIYDVRRGGGFAPAPAPEPPCEGESCQNPSTAPNDPTPASVGFKGPGNVKQGGTKPRCRKGKRKVRKAGKSRCVAKGKKQQKRRANNNGRTGR